MKKVKKDELEEIGVKLVNVALGVLGNYPDSKKTSQVDIAKLIVKAFCVTRKAWVIENETKEGLADPQEILATAFWLWTVGETPNDLPNLSARSFAGTTLLGYAQAINAILKISEAFDMIQDEYGCLIGDGSAQILLETRAINLSNGETK